MVLVKFDNDTIVRPAETELFGFYKPGQEKLIQTLEQSDFYHKVYLSMCDIFFVINSSLIHLHYIIFIL